MPRCFRRQVARCSLATVGGQSAAYEAQRLTPHGATLVEARVTEAQIRNARTTPATVVFIWIFSWFVSRFLFAWYTKGDLVSYRRYWDVAANTSTFSDAFRNLYVYLGAPEPGYAAMAHLLAGHISHDNFMSVLNATLIVCALVLLRRLEAPNYFILLLAMNYYTLVLLIPAERLKVASLVFVATFLFRPKWRFFGWMATPLLHLQLLLVLVVVLLDRIFGRGGARAHMSFIARGGLVLLMGLVAYVTYRVTGAGALRKVDAYTTRAVSESWDWLPSALVLVIIVTVFPRRFGSVVAAICLTLMAIVLGGTRVNMMAILFLAVVFAQERRFSHPIILLTMIYFAWRGATFLITVHATGTAF